MTTKFTKAEQAEALETLKDTLKDVDRLYTILRHVSSSGMSRVISVAYVNSAGEIDTLDWLIAKAGIYSRTPISSKHDGLKVSGVGMDMGYDVVYTISRLVLGNDSLKQYWL